MSIRSCCVVQIFFLMIFLYRSSKLLKGEVLKFTIKVVNLFISPFLSINIYFTYFETLLVGAYIFKIIISSSFLLPQRCLWLSSLFFFNFFSLCCLDWVTPIDLPSSSLILYWWFSLYCWVHPERFLFMSLHFSFQ